MPVDMPPVFYASMNKHVADDVAKGGQAHAGQWGSIVVQFPDYYIEYSAGLGIRNSGQWKATKTFAGNVPGFNGVEGERVLSEDGMAAFGWGHGHWDKLWDHRGDPDWLAHEMAR